MQAKCSSIVVSIKKMFTSSEINITTELYYNTSSITTEYYSATESS